MSEAIPTETPTSEYRVKPALCLDIDGTIRYSKSGDFITTLDDIVLYPDVEAKLWEYRKKGYLILGITNQGGVAFGYKTQAVCEAEMAHTLGLFGKDPFHIVRQCFAHPHGHVEPYNAFSLQRKPQPGMLAVIEAKLLMGSKIVVDWKKSLFVGDRQEDKDCARIARIKFEWAWQFFGRPEPVVPDPAPESSTPKRVPKK